MLTATLVWMMLICICVDSNTGVDDVDVHLTVALVWMMLICFCVDSSTGVDDVHVHLLTVALAGWC